LESSGEPFLGVGSGNLGVADVHGDIVDPSGHLAGNLDSLDRDIGPNSFGLAIFAEVDQGGVEDGLDILA
jgi:hypothetical protein